MSNIKSKADSTEFIKSLDELIKKTPQCVKALQLRGVFQIPIEKYDEAKMDFLKAKKIDSLNPYTLYFLGMLCNFENKNDSAIYYLNTAIRLKNPKGYIIETNNLFHEELDIEYNRIIHYRGIVLFEQGRNALSKKDFLECISYNYHGYDTFGYLAAIYNAYNQIDSACFFHQKTIAGGPDFVVDTSLLRKCK